MIEKLIPNVTYYCGNSKPPFYTEQSCIALNEDGTYATKEHKRYSVTTHAESSWCYTKEEAVRDMIGYYIEQFKDKDVSGKAVVYIEFVKAIEPHIKKHYPEYLI